MKKYQDGDTWGPRVYLETNLTWRLVLKGVEQYEIDLETCHTTAEVLDWIVRLKKEGWISVRDLGNLVFALDDLLDLQNNLIHGGSKLNVAKYLQR